MEIYRFSSGRLILRVLSDKHAGFLSAVKNHDPTDNFFDVLARLCKWHAERSLAAKENLIASEEDRLLKSLTEKLFTTLDENGELFDQWSALLTSDDVSPYKSYLHDNWLCYSEYFVLGRLVKCSYYWVGRSTYQNEAGHSSLKNQK